MNGRNTLTLAGALALAVAFLPGKASAQLELGQRSLGVHVGLSGVGSAAALGVHGEVAYNENIGIGAFLDTWSYGQDYAGLGGGSWNVRYIALAGTGSWHFPVESNPKLDPFVGLGLGYFVVNTSWDGAGGAGSYGGSGSRVFVDGFAGLRYHFRPTLSGVVRAGASASYLTVGLDLRL